MPKKSPDLDFKIHIDESCLTTPMDEEPEVPQNEEVVGVVEPEKAPALQASVEDDDAEGFPEQSDQVVNEPEPESHTTEDTITETVEDVQEEDDVGEEQADEEPVDECGDTSAITEPDNTSMVSQPEDDISVVASVAEDEDDDATPRPSHAVENEDEPAVESRRASLRTEALIQAAARAVVASIEEQDQHEDDPHEDEGDSSILTTTTDASDEPSRDADREVEPGDNSRRNSGLSENLQIPSMYPAESVHGSEGGDSSSHHEGDEDVFTDRSGRSSLGSSDGTDDRMSKAGDNETVQHHDDYEYRRSPRVSGVSGISAMSQYEDEEFVPTARGTPRPAFRTPSAVRAMQLSSPPPSVFSSPRSTKRPTGHFPTISRLGSPNPSAQYSPKGRSTPPRFKSKKDAPLLLLHVTLLPLRWMWGEVVDDLDGTKGFEGYEPDDQMKSLRDSWRLLQDRTGDTVLDRGILIAHPQNDFEVLEERLLEALELPLKRRARILECGHYLGPSNVSTLCDDDSVDSDDEYASQADAGQKRHWCGICRCDIKYEDLGAGRIFRVKVYASNGLMKAGAWEACWSQMERIDVEVEPLVEVDLQRNLEHLSALQAEQQRQKEADHHLDEQHEEYLPEAEDSFVNVTSPERSPEHLHASPPEPATVPAADIDVERLRREEERRREIYGETPLPDVHHEPTSSMHPHPDSYRAPPTPPSPSEQAFERRESRRHQGYQNASLPELLLDSARVVFRDPKNVAIALLTVLVLVFAVRTAPQDPNARALDRDADIIREIYGRAAQVEKVPIMNEKTAEVKTNIAPPVVEPVVDTPVSVVDSVSASTNTPAPPVAETTKSAAPSSVLSIDPCESPATEEPQAEDGVLEVLSSKVPPEPLVETFINRKVVRVYETVTETETVKVTATATATATESVRVPKKQNAVGAYEPRAAAASS